MRCYLDHEVHNMTPLKGCVRGLLHYGYSRRYCLSTKGRGPSTFELFVSDYVCGYVHIVGFDCCMFYGWSYKL